MKIRVVFSMILNNLYDINSLTIRQIDEISKMARDFQLNKIESTVKGKNAVIYFDENSTRTRFSFEVACRNLGIRVFNFNKETSSIQKKESFIDTVRTLEALGMDVLIIRTGDERLFNEILNNKDLKIKFINAGCSTKSHPTQALTDYYTLKRHFSSLNGKTISIVGDILHSRVARSDIEIFRKFDMNINLVAPVYFQDINIKNVNWFDNLYEGLKDACAVVALRVQNERIDTTIPLIHYVKNYRLDINNFPQNALLLHPGPQNRDIEVTDELLKSKNANTILEQVTNGVYVRMAILQKMLSDNEIVQK